MIGSPCGRLTRAARTPKVQRSPTARGLSVQKCGNFGRNDTSGIIPKCRWYKKMVPFGIDNMAFERSAAKGRSAAARLNDLLRGLFVLQVKFTFIISPYWLSSADNSIAGIRLQDKYVNQSAHG